MLMMLMMMMMMIMMNIRSLRGKRCRRFAVSWLCIGESCQDERASERAGVASASSSSCFLFDNCVGVCTVMLFACLASEFSLTHSQRRVACGWLEAFLGR